MGNFGSSKSYGWLGAQKLFLFSKALAAKVRWRLLLTNGLWNIVVLHKYIALNSLENWIHNPDKISHLGSIIWKAMINYFLVIEEGLAWRIGNGTRVSLGVDPWLGCGHDHILLEELIVFLYEHGL
jgi:hypothetical protein